jgi:hypothetical protein
VNTLLRAGKQCVTVLKILTGALRVKEEEEWEEEEEVGRRRRRRRG